MVCEDDGKEMEVCVMCWLCFVVCSNYGLLLRVMILVFSEVCKEIKEIGEIFIFCIVIRCSKIGDEFFNMFLLLFKFGCVILMFF